MSFAAIAAGVSVAATVGSAAYSASQASGAAGAAGKDIREGIRNVLGETGYNDQYNQRLFAPYISQRDTYGGRLGDLLIGGSLSKPYTWADYVGQSGLAPGTSQQQFLQPYTAGEFGQAIQQPGWSLADLYQGMTPADFKRDYGYDIKQALQEFQGRDLEDSPGYRFRLGQGLQALDRTAAARGNALSGGATKAAERYAQDYASGEFQNAWARDMARKQTALGQYNTAFGQSQQDLSRKQGLYELLAGQDWASKQAQLDNYYKAMQGNLVQNASLFDRLKGMYDSANQGVFGLAGLRQHNTDSRNAAFTGGATTSGQNAWNSAQANSQAIGGGLSGLGNLASLFMLMNGGGMFGGGATGGAIGGGTKGL